MLLECGPKIWDLCRIVRWPAVCIKVWRPYIFEIFLDLNPKSEIGMIDKNSKSLAFWLLQFKGALEILHCRIFPQWGYPPPKVLSFFAKKKSPFWEICNYDPQITFHPKEINLVFLHQMGWDMDQKRLHMDPKGLKMDKESAKNYCFLSARIIQIAKNLQWVSRWLIWVWYR